MGRKKMLDKIRHKERKRNAGKCRNKVRYGFAEAQLWGRQYRQKPYKCYVCDDWHLTSQRK